MPADVLFLIVLCALAIAIFASWRAAKRSTEFTFQSDKAAAGYALLSAIGSATVLAILAAVLPWGAL